MLSPDDLKMNDPKLNQLEDIIRYIISSKKEKIILLLLHQAHEPKQKQMFNKKYKYRDYCIHL